jgi:gliding motility-associated lipoprotein GldD
MRYYGTLLLALLIFAPGCDEEINIPKPPTYLRLEIPDHSYKVFDDPCPYRFEISELYAVKAVSDGENLTCHKDIDLGPLNGALHLSYIDMEEPLATYVNFVNDKVDEHKVKATAIEDKNFINAKTRVFGTFFELQGDVASPFQFYLTDSVKRFVSGVVYFNCVPKYDSLKPSLDYLKVDIEHMINSFEWQD